MKECSYLGSKVALPSECLNDTAVAVEAATATAASTLRDFAIRLDAPALREVRGRWGALDSKPAGAAPAATSPSEPLAATDGEEQQLSVSRSQVYSNKVQVSRSQDLLLMIKGEAWCHI